MIRRGRKHSTKPIPSPIRCNQVELALALNAEQTAAVPLAQALGHLSRAERDLGVAAELAGVGKVRDQFLEAAVGVRALMDGLLLV